MALQNLPRTRAWTVKADRTKRQAIDVLYRVRMYLAEEYFAGNKWLDSDARDAFALICELMRNM